MNSYEAIAEAMMAGRDYADGIAADHMREYEQPLTLMAKAQLMRSVIQALAVAGEIKGHHLVDSYLSFGRVEVVREQDRMHLLLKARSALPVNSHRQEALWRPESDIHPGILPLHLLLYTFGRDELQLAVVPVQDVKLNGRRQFQLLGDVTEVGSWDLSPSAQETFDQGPVDDFGDLSEGVFVAGADST